MKIIQVNQVSTPILLGLCVVVLIAGGMAARLASPFSWLLLLCLLPLYLVIMKELFRRRDA